MIRNERLTPEEAAFVELAVGHLGRLLPGCMHRFEYRLACVVRGVWAFSGPPQGGPRLTFASPALMWRVLTPDRWAVLEAMTGAGPAGVAGDCPTRQP